jgi:hypothetical protein
VPATSFQLLDPIHAKPAIPIITIGQGALMSSFSNHTRKCRSGSKKIFYTLSIRSREFSEARVDALLEISQTLAVHGWE